MPVPSVITDLSATASSNSPAATDAVFPDLDNYLRAHAALIRQGDAKASDIASATTTSIGAAAGRIVDVTGTTTITSFGTVAAGVWKVVRFTGALTLTHSGTSLILPGAANITTAAGDSLIAVSLGSGNWYVTAFTRAADAAVQLAATQTLTNKTLGSGCTWTGNVINAAYLPSLNQNTTGNAATATKLETARTINGTSFDGSANITITANTTNSLTINNGGSGEASGTTFNGSAAKTISYNSVGAPSTGGTNATGTWGISITGNAATVTGGVYTSGDQTIAGTKTFSSTISGSVSGNAGTVTNGVYTTGDQEIAGIKSFTGTRLNVNGASGSYGGTLYLGNRHIRYVTSTGAWEMVNVNNNAILATFEDNGNFTALGTVTGSSDERLKADWTALPADFVARLASVTTGTYSRIDTGARQVGVSAQSLRELLPEAVLEDSRGMLSVAYGNAALVACVALAKEVQALRARVEALGG